MEQESKREHTPGPWEWIDVRDQPPPQNEPVVYARPNPFRPGSWHVGIAYWTVSQKWNPEAESQQAPRGFTHWKPLGEQPRPDEFTDLTPWKADAAKEQQ